MATSDLDVEAETERLYQLPLAEFVAARNALAARLKSGGNKDDAASVRALARPNVSAWAANQAYWTARREFDALVEATRRLQAAQAEGAPGATLREAMKARREAHAAVTARAESLLVAAGHGASPDTLRRVSDTLEALAAESARPDGARSRPGRLVGDLEAPGFEAITQVAVAPSPDTPRPEAGHAKERANEARAMALERARAELAEAERSLESARRQAREATGARSIAQERARAARIDLDESTRRFQSARDRAAFAEAAEEAALEEAERKSGACDRAEAARDAALRSLRDME
jgi:hypothetical protein